MNSLPDEQRQPYERPTVTPAGPDPYRLTGPLDDPTTDRPRQPTTGDRLAEVKARRGAATPGPWWDSPVKAAPGHHTIRGGPGEWRGFDGSLGGDTHPIARIAPALAEDGTPTTNHDADAAFIAHAPEDIDWLVTEVDRLREDRTKLSVYAGNVEAKLAELRTHLASIEWAAADAAGTPAQAICPACEVLAPGPHAPDCWLAEAIGRRP
jgi:hypothetical protein